MRQSFGLEGGGGSAVELTRGDGAGGAVLGGAVLFCGESKGEHGRARERAGVSGEEARGGADNGRQLTASMARRRPTMATRRPRSAAGQPLKPVDSVSSVLRTEPDSVLSS